MTSYPLVLEELEPINMLATKTLCVMILKFLSMQKVLESSSDPYIDDLLKSLGVRDRVPDDSSFFLQVGAGGAAGRVRQKATQPPVPTSADAVPCSCSKILISSNIVYQGV